MSGMRARRHASTSSGKKARSAAQPGVSFTTR
jgi:hypothetical protein